jgi:DNA-binding NarL/FixJ family response regulator
MRIYTPPVAPLVSEGISPRLRALLVGEDPMLRYLVRETLAKEGIATSQEASSPTDLSAQTRHENSTGVVVLCLSGPPEIWQRTISETRRSLPGGRVVSVTFGDLRAAPGAHATDARLGADVLVPANEAAGSLRDALLRAKFVRSPRGSGSGTPSQP